MGQYLCKYFRNEKWIIILRNNHATANVTIFRYTDCQKLNITLKEEQKSSFYGWKILQYFPVWAISKIWYLAKVFHLLTFLEALLWFFQVLSHTEYSMFPLCTSEVDNKRFCGFFFLHYVLFITIEKKKKNQKSQSLDLSLLENWIRSVNGFRHSPFPRTSTESKSFLSQNWKKEIPEQFLKMWLKWELICTRVVSGIIQRWNK